MALQEFLASYAVQVDEDGAGRLQSILEQNREAGQQLAEVFNAARTTLAGLKKELSESSGLRNILSGLSVGGSRLPFTVPSALGSLSGSLSAAGLPGMQEGTRLSVGADFSAADTALADFRSRLEAERPRLSVNSSGISAAVSSAVASIRSMMSSLRVTVPVTAVPKLDSSKLNLAGTGSTGSSGSVPSFGSGGRVATPTLALIAEEGKPEYVIPTGDEGRAVPLLRGLLSELSINARNSALSGLSSGESLRGSLADWSAAARASMMPSGASMGGIHSVQAPVNIQVVSHAAAPEAVARSIYDTAERSLLKTLKGVFM